MEQSRHICTAIYSSKPLTVLGWVLICAMQFWVVGVLFFGGMFFYDSFLANPGLYKALAIIFLVANIMWFFYDRKRLLFAKQGKQILVKANETIRMQEPVKIANFWGYSFYENVKTTFEMPTIKREKGHGTTDVLVMIMRDANGQEVVLSQELAPWSQSPPEWEYLDLTEFAPKNHWKIKGLTKVLASLQAETGTVQTQ